LEPYNTFISFPFLADRKIEKEGGMSHRKTLISFVLGQITWMALGAVGVSARTWEVGPGKSFAKPSAVADSVKDGDTVAIAPGLYTNEATTWRKNRLTLRGTSAYAHITPPDSIPNGKGIWVITGDKTVVENMEFSGAKVKDQNGAGIRQEGPSITIRNCYFHDNENGVLTDGGNGDVLIEYSEFSHNGVGEVGRTHNMYIGPVGTFTLQFCYTHDAVIGHTVKSRAKKNYILYNRIMDESEASSYEVDLPNGGESYVIGNLIQQRNNGGNPVMVSIGEEPENGRHEVNMLYVINNTFVDEEEEKSGGSCIYVASGVNPAKAINNLIIGPKTKLGNVSDTLANLKTNAPGLMDRVKFDYRLSTSSPAINKGKDPGTANFPLLPQFEYVNKAQKKQRIAIGALDIGAYEYEDGASLWNVPRHGYSPKRRKVINTPKISRLVSGRVKTHD
jgi:hypothetical protein